MKIESTLFGSFEITEDKVIEFPAGLPGFEQCRRFAMVHDEGSDAPVMMLQSAEEPDVVFSLADPASFGVHYEFELSDEEQASLKLASPDQALVAVIVRKDEKSAGSPTGAGLRANFMAPMIINIEAKRGMQKVISRMECDIIMRVKD